MTNRQNTFFQMANAVKVVCDTFATTWSETPSFATPQELLIDNVLDKLPDAAGKQSTSTKGVTQDKKTARIALGTNLQSIAAALEAFAITINNQTLKTDAHVTATDVAHATDDALLGIEKRISGLATEHLAALAPFGITAARISALDHDASAFTDWIGKPRATRAISKDGTQMLDSLVALGRSYLEAMDGQMILFKDTAPDFYNQYFTARKLVPTGSRVRAMFFNVTDNSNHALSGALVQIDALDVKRVTSANGNCFVQDAAPGIYTATVTKNGYNALTATINVNDGETAHVDVMLSEQ